MAAQKCNPSEAADRADEIGTEILELSSVLDRGADGIEAHEAQGINGVGCAVRIMRNVSRQLSELDSRQTVLRNLLREAEASSAKEVVNG